MNDRGFLRGGCALPSSIVASLLAWVLCAGIKTNQFKNILIAIPKRDLLFNTPHLAGV